MVNRTVGNALTISPLNGRAAAAVSWIPVFTGTTDCGFPAFAPDRQFQSPFAPRKPTLCVACDP